MSAQLKLLGQQEAVAVDEDLMATPGYSVDQLMELAGLSVAAAVADAYARETHPRVLVVCGPGNNNCDGRAHDTRNNDNEDDNHTYDGNNDDRCQH